ncbi:MAG TPA: hypothetical protein DDW78_01375 [Treponema sp.]|nr:hypothetical protein [Treponema sp.]
MAAEQIPVLLVADDDSLVPLCRAELGSGFFVHRVAASEYMLALKAQRGCHTVLLDCSCMDEIDIMTACTVISKEFGLSLVLLMSKEMRLSDHLARALGTVHTVDVFSPAGTLRGFVCGSDDVAYSVRHTESAPLTFLSPQDEVAKEAVQPPPAEDNIVASSFIMNHFYERIKKASQTDENILLLGESGSGKSWTARKIHELSPRSTKKFFKVNVAEFNANLIESNLFGTTSGAFTDAGDHKGVFSAADGGTLFLDEIGELPVLLQSKLLGVLETHSYRRLGSTKEYTFDEKIIFATNRDLEECIQKGTFRKDLYYRISSIVLEVPPLRDHPEDIPELARRIAGKRNKQLSQSAVEKLMEYTWPGNIRELESIVKRACIFSPAECISADDIRFS